MYKLLNMADFCSNEELEKDMKNMVLMPLNELNFLMRITVL